MISLAFAVSCAEPASPQVGGRAQKLRVTTIADATCALRAPGSSDAGLRLTSDHSGRISFQVRRLDLNAPAAVQLDCDDARGLHRSQWLDIDALLSEARPDTDVDASEVLRVRPALTADPATVTARELAAGGYPPRPNAAVDSPAYRDWLDDVTQPSRVLAFDGDAARDSIRFEEKTGWIWCGAVATSGRYDWVSGGWTEPYVKSSGNELQQTGGIWVGLGGVNNETLIQAGTRFDVYPLSDTQYMKPQVFREVVDDTTADNDPIPCKNCNFEEGDHVVFSAKVETRDENGGGTGLLYYSNLTKGESATAEMPFTGVTGATAEWILEDPLGLGTTLPDFGTVRFEGAQTYSDEQGYRNLGDNDYDTYADGGGDSPYNCKPNVVDSTSLDVTRVL